jgi:hypothetical protein
MFDDGDGRIAESIREANGRVEIEEIVVRKFLPMDLLERLLSSLGIERCLLLRVLAVTKILKLFEADGESGCREPPR